MACGLSHFLYDYVLACFYVCVRQRQRKGWKKGGKESKKERKRKRDRFYLLRKWRKRIKGGKFIKNRTEL